MTVPRSGVPALDNYLEEPRYSRGSAAVGSRAGSLDGSYRECTLQPALVNSPRGVAARMMFPIFVGKPHAVSDLSSAWRWCLAEVLTARTLHLRPSAASSSATTSGISRFDGPVAELSCNAH